MPDTADLTEDALFTLLPDKKVSVREAFGVDSDMMVPAFSTRDPHVPDLDTAYQFDPEKGALKPLQIMPTLPATYTGDNTGAEIAVAPSGRLVYGSNRGHDSLAIFAIDPLTGKLTAAGHQSTGGKTPRNFAIDPTGAYLFAANQESNNIVIFRISRQTGSLTPTGQVLEVPSPVSVAFMASE